MQDDGWFWAPVTGVHREQRCNSTVITVITMMMVKLIMTAGSALQSQGYTGSNAATAQ